VAGSGRFPPDVKEVGALGDHAEALLDGGVMVGHPVAAE
jgi:hypothetical protein